MNARKVPRCQGINSTGKVAKKLGTRKERKKQKSREASIQKSCKELTTNHVRKFTRNKTWNHE